MSTDNLAKSPRILACILCQQRKVRCDRKFPCANCIGAGTQCVPGTLSPRRRRFPERLLLDRLRHYEDLLRQHSIDFEPLHPQAKQESAADVSHVSHDHRQSEVSASRAKAPIQSQAMYGT
ncbi:Transcription factor [Aspergillus sclerotialis]|uniref:Transcription factor n=1 Tax=Aspergillus sclerotialis TaxID=2070753 RepID=A0A3A2ZXB1_9EURO|nr:Transcription factor [Aspergillus sclerotialis]